MRRRTVITTLVAVALATLAVVPASTTASAAAFDPTAGVPAALRPFYRQHLVWKPCHTQLQCATFRVPLDYAHPTGARITITAARALATGPSRGALVVNPGGPGGSGIEYIADPKYAASATARRNFDLVSFDPRGVGESTPLWCLRGKQLDAFLNVTPAPTTAAERAAVVRAGTSLAAACQRENAALLPHLSAVDIARDMDVLRGLLGEARLRYLGKSWGTVLGTVYAALFPSRVGSFVLDGPVDLQVPPLKATYQQGQGFETAIDHFIAWCLRQGSCPLGATPAAAKARLVSFIAGLDGHPLPTADRARPLTEAQALTAIIGPLYLTSGGWQWLLTGLTPALTTGNGAALQSIFDWFVERNPDGTYANNTNTVIYAMNCLDQRSAVRSAAQAQQLAATWSRTLPVMGATMAWSDLPCASWPVHAAIDIAKLRVHNVPPILVVGATYDPATPLPWARGLASELPGARLLIRSGDGHTSYANGDTCIDHSVDAFLLSTDVRHPVLPAAGTVCGAAAA